MPTLTAVATQIRGLEIKIYDIRKKCDHRFTPTFQQIQSETSVSNTFWNNSYEARCTECELRCVVTTSAICSGCEKDISKVDFRAVTEDEYKSFIEHPLIEIVESKALNIKTCECGRSVLEKYLDT